MFESRLFFTYDGTQRAEYIVTTKNTVHSRDCTGRHRLFRNISSPRKSANCTAYMSRAPVRSSGHGRSYAERPKFEIITFYTLVWYDHSAKSQALIRECGVCSQGHLSSFDFSRASIYRISIVYIRLRSASAPQDIYDRAGMLRKQRLHQLARGQFYKFLEIIIARDRKVTIFRAYRRRDW